MSPWFALARADRVNVLRDPMLLGALVVPLPLGVLVRFGRAPLADALAPWVSSDALDPVIGSFVLVLPALMAGTVQGFLRLEERDEHVEAAIRVSALGLGGLWRWRLGTSLALGIPTSALAWALAGLEATPTLPLGLLVGGLHAPIIALVLARARDKVAGLAVSKITSLAAVAQVTWWLPAPAHLLGGVAPAWWVAWGLGDGGHPAMVVALALTLLAGAVLVASRR